MELVDLGIGAGDCKYCSSILEDDEKSRTFHNLMEELADLWNDMFHRGGPVPRKIIIQTERPKEGEFADMEPIYRHPVDISPPSYSYTPLVKSIRDRVENLLKLTRGSLNHVLIQLYSDGESHISDHSDKTLDILKNTPIINVSIGAVRKIKIKNKIKTIDSKNVNKIFNNKIIDDKMIIHNRKSEFIELENGSAFVMGWDTNRKFYHGINQDKRMDSLKTEGELAFGKTRISLTFRNIATFIDSNGMLHGQGAPKNDNQNTNNNNILNSLEDEEIQMLKAFSAENRETCFDWDLHYGRGFRCINFKTLAE